MSVKVKCHNCKWSLELDDDTLVKDLPMTCPQCDCHLVIIGIAHWMRDVPDYAL